MDIDVEERKQQLAVFSTFIDSTSCLIDEKLQSVGWTRDHLLNENTEMVACSLNPEHRVPKKSLDSHLQMCAWRREGYHELDVSLPENVSKSESANSTIVIDAFLQETIIKEAKEKDPYLLTGDLETNMRLVPKTSNRLVADFTSDERRILYDYVISKTTPVEDVKVEELHLIGDPKQDEKPHVKSKLELLIEQRDAKRRRISYKKKVHTNRKSHTEILREVIQNQMELLEQIVKGDCDEDKDETHSLGGEEENLLSHQKDPVKNHGFKESGSIIKREKDIDQEVRKRDTKDPVSPEENSVIHHIRRRFDRKELHSETSSGNSRNYRREDNSRERKEGNESKEYKSYKMQDSFDKKISREKPRSANKNWEMSKEYRTYDRVKGDNYHKSRKNSEDLGQCSSKQYKNRLHHNIPEHDVYKREYYSPSKYDRNTSNSFEQDVNYEREYYSQSKHRRISSKYYSHEHEHSRDYEMKSHSKAGVSSQKDDFRNCLYDSYDKKSNRSNTYIDHESRDNATSKECDESFQHKDHRVRTFRGIKEEADSDSTNQSRKLRKLKKRKKKHKHKHKKRNKEKHHSGSASNSSSRSCSEKSDSNSDSS